MCGPDLMSRGLIFGGGVIFGRNIVLVGRGLIFGMIYILEGLIFGNLRYVKQA